MDVLHRAGVSADLLRAAMREVRQKWGTGEYYLAAIDRDDRDQIAREALQSGTSIQHAAEKAGCSPRTVRRRKSRWF